MNVTTQELLAAAYDANPEFVEKTAKALYVLERTDPVGARELSEDIEALTAFTTEKVAGINATHIGTQLAVGTGSLLAAGLASSIASDLYDSAKKGLTKSRNFNRIMDDPSNKALLKGTDASVLRRSFNTFHRYAPEFTADPLLGGSILKAMTEVPENNLVNIKDLISAQKALRETQGSQFKPTSPGMKLKEIL
jgi:hypothetical protein